MQGYARYLAEALPNAKRTGFTETPISFSGADTVEVFGDVINIYDFRRSQVNKVTVQIYYVPRHAQVNLNKTDVDTAQGEIVRETIQEQVGNVVRKKSQWAALRWFPRTTEQSCRCYAA